MSEINIGGAYLRLLGAGMAAPDEPNPASDLDALNVIDAMMTSEALRARCHALSALSKDISVEARKSVCRALLIWMVTQREPAQGPPIKEDEGTIDYESFANTTQEYASLASPRPGSVWSPHVEGKYKKSSAPEYVRVSPYLAELISAFEALFGIQGALLAR